MWKPTSSAGFQVQRVLGRNKLCEFGVVKPISSEGFQVKGVLGRNL